MDHVVYLDASAKELDLLCSGKKRMIIRGATGALGGKALSGDD